MPRHDYKCDCGYEIEEITKFGDPTPECPKCHKATKLIFKQAPVIHFDPITDQFLRDDGVI